MNNLPKDMRDVLARVESQRDLGKTSWYEVVYHNGEEWRSYYGSDTFSTLGDNVIDWVYCDDVLPKQHTVTHNIKSKSHIVYGSLL